MSFRPKVPSPAMVVACGAMLVALGGTSYAAVTLPHDSVGANQIKPGAVTSVKIKNHTIGLADIGAAATKQLGAAAGTPAYGDVAAAVSNGGVSVAHGWNGAIEHIGVGVYCLHGFAAAPTNVVASVDASSPDLGASAQAMVGSSLCPSGTQVEVQTYDDTGDRANEPFDFMAN